MSFATHNNLLGEIILHCIDVICTQVNIVAHQEDQQHQAQPLTRGIYL
jgi:hypothetical protein